MNIQIFKRGCEIPEVAISVVKREAQRRKKVDPTDTLWRISFLHQNESTEDFWIVAWNTKYSESQVDGILWGRQIQDIAYYGFAEPWCKERVCEIAMCISKEGEADESEITEALHQGLYEYCEKSRIEMVFYDQNKKEPIWKKKRENKEKSHFLDEDLRNRDFSYIDFSNSTFERCRFDGGKFVGANLSNVKAEGCSFLGVEFTDANLTSGNFRYADFTGADLGGALCYCALFEYTKLEAVKFNSYTQYYEMICPSEGAFLAYKKCVNDQIVTLLIPEDAMRTSATGITCRASKAKVLKIESYDGTQEFREAYSLVNEDFYYRVGEMAEVNDFNANRWMDSTTGIHFFMTRTGAMKY